MFLTWMCLQKHDIPISAVPCLKYQRELEKERQLQQLHNSEPSTSGVPVDGLYLFYVKQMCCFVTNLKNMCLWNEW